MTKSSNNMKINFVSVGGYAVSGGASVRDILKEFKCFKDIGTEFRLIKDPYGIMDLEESLVKNWRDNLNSDLAIKNFKWLANNLSRNESKFSRIGFSYNKRINPDFNQITSEYIHSLTDFQYKANWHLLRFDDSYLKQIYNKVLGKLNIDEKLKIIYYSIPTQDMFTFATKSYIEKLFSSLSENGKFNIVLHNGIPTKHAQKAFKYFQSIKMIIVDRDPRDTFVDVINRKVNFFLGEQLIEQENANIFVKDFLKRREDQIKHLKDKRILLLRFEDLVLNYEESLTKIYNFLEINAENHILKGKYFNPEISKKNIGLWKNFSNKKPLNFIAKNLSDYLHTD